MIFDELEFSESFNTYLGDDQCSAELLSQIAECAAESERQNESPIVLKAR